MTTPGTSGKSLVVRLFLMIIVFDAVMAAVIVAALQLPGPWVGPTITAVVVIGALALIRYAITGFWNPLIAPWPPREVPREAIRRSFQSFRIDLVNMGFSINAAVDDEYLHLEPIAVWRLFGAESASIPFDQMVRSDRGRSVRIEGRVIRGPKWCFEKACAQA